MYGEKTIIGKSDEKVLSYSMKYLKLGEGKISKKKY